MALRLRQGQVWKGTDEFVRIVQLERLEVKYKTMPDLSSGKGEHRTGTKKEFCRLIKGYTLLTAKGQKPDKAGPIDPPPTEKNTSEKVSVEEPASESVIAEDTVTDAASPESPAE